jgi:hypothetical protein
VILVWSVRYSPFHIFWCIHPQQRDDVLRQAPPSQVEEQRHYIACNVPRKNREGCSRLWVIPVCAWDGMGWMPISCEFCAEISGRWCFADTYTNPPWSDTSWVYFDVRGYFYIQRQGLARAWIWFHEGDGHAVSARNDPWPLLQSPSSHPRMTGVGLESRRGVVRI